MNCIDFIGVWKKHVPDEFCDELIEYIEKSQLTRQLGTNTMMRQDFSTHIFPSQFNKRTDPDGEKKSIYDRMNGYLGSCLDEYLYQFSALQVASYFNSEIKLQKTEPTQGYHLWHCENAGIQFMQRAMVWSVYLNDIPDNEGETEFLYQKLRVNPEKGMVLIWPGGYTHTHRGNPPYTKTKYIATGWYSFMPDNGMVIQDEDGSAKFTHPELQDVKVTTMSNDE